MKKVMLLIVLATLTIATYAQGNKKSKVKSKAPVAAPAPGQPKLHVLYVTDDDLTQLIGAAATGWSSWIMTQHVYADEIQKYHNFFGNRLQDFNNQQQAWQKAEADSVATYKARQDSITAVNAKRDSLKSKK